MGYEVLADAVTVHQTLSESKAPDGSVVYDHGNGRVYTKGMVIADEDVSTIVKKLYEDGDEHVKSMFKKTSADPSEGGATMEEHYMGPDTGSPGVIKPDAAAVLAEAQAKTGEGDRELAEGLSDKALKAVESGEVELETAGGKAPAPSVPAPEKPAAPASKSAAKRKS